jgi:hypothetical protein
MPVSIGLLLDADGGGAGVDQELRPAALFMQPLRVMKWPCASAESATMLPAGARC